MRLPEVRKAWQLQSDRLRRARHLYAVMTKITIDACSLEDRDAVMDRITTRALEGGLWKGQHFVHGGGFGSGSHREVRYTLLRRWWRIDVPVRTDQFSWYGWQAEHNWIVFTWRTAMPQDNQQTA